MRNLLLVVVILFAIISCDKDKTDNTTSSGILIKGKIPQGSLKSSGTKSIGVIPLSDAKKVGVVNLSNGILRIQFIDITDGSFTATAELGMSTALIFLDVNSKYIGTLSTRGLNLLPLGKLADGENTTIDLADLSPDSTSIIPSHDPFGKEIIISDGEINRLKEVDGFFESLGKNIDADNNNILDATVNKQLFIKTRFGSRADHWGINGTPPQMSDIDMTQLGYTLELDGDYGFSKPASIVVTGPLDSPYDNISTSFINDNGNGGFFAGISRNDGLFKKGTYSINIDGYLCTLNYSNNDVKLNQIFVLPTLHTNTEGNVVSVSLEYKLPDGSPIDPVNILTDVGLYFYNDSNQQYHSSPWLRNEGASIDHCICVSGVYSYAPETPIDISHLVRITIAYNDLLGNTYFINWDK